jgi:pimeloyl-ACP methyl ester carboxylesterase
VATDEKHILTGDNPSNETPSATADQWFAMGQRIPYDHAAKRILRRDGATGSPNVVSVFQRAVRGGAENKERVWTTFLPGFPDGSFGWARVDRLLADDGPVPRLYLEFVGQGDSDKPTDYPYSTFERADLVDAVWEAHEIRSTFLVTFDYSSLVALELLSRRQERLDRGADLTTSIDGVLLVNGGLFADAHSHPWFTTPTLKSALGTPITWVGQRSRFAFAQLLKPLFSREYGVRSEELNEIYEAVSRRDGVAFLRRAAAFVDEHRANADRWDLRRLFLALRDDVSFHVAGSQGDPFEPNQIVKARERLADEGLDIHVLPGGHMATSEHPDLLAQLVRELGPER